MDNKSYHVRIPKRWARVTLIIATTALIVAPLTAIASHSFTDVPDTNTFHADIAWLADAGVTKGCNPPANTEFCPNDNVSRGQMSAFMRRFAQYIDAEDGTPGQADNATTADSATTAASADNADKLDGLDSTDLQTTAYSARTETFVDVPASSTVDVMTLDLPAGSYLIQARASLNQNFGSIGRNIECTLTAGSTSQTLENFQTEPNTGIDTLDNSFMIVHTFDAAGQAVLSCEGFSGWSGNVIDPSITAISVSNVVATVSGAASSGGDANN